MELKLLNASTPLPPLNLSTFFIKPYGQSLFHFKSFFVLPEPEVNRCCKAFTYRVAHLVLCVALLIPIINGIVLFVLLRREYKLESQRELERKQQEEQRRLAEESARRQLEMQQSPASPEPVTVPAPKGLIGRIRRIPAGIWHGTLKVISKVTGVNATSAVIGTGYVANGVQAATTRNWKLTVYNLWAGGVFLTHSVFKLFIPSDVSHAMAIDQFGR